MILRDNGTLQNPKGCRMAIAQQMNNLYHYLEKRSFVNFTLFGDSEIKL
jgi:hypothetical protein